MTYIYTFEKLEIWQIAKTITLAIYKITNTFPTEEKFGLISQLRRASISIAYELNLINEQIFCELRSKIEELSNKINSLYKYHISNIQINK